MAHKSSYYIGTIYKLNCAADTKYIMSNILFYKIFNYNIHNNVIDDVKFPSRDNDAKLILLLHAHLHIIDHRSVLYLTLLQILLYNQQYMYNQSLYNNNSNDDAC